MSGWRAAQLCIDHFKGVPLLLMKPNTEECHLPLSPPRPLSSLLHSCPGALANQVWRRCDIWIRRSSKTAGHPERLLLSPACSPPTPWSSSLVTSPLLWSHLALRPHTFPGHSSPPANSIFILPCPLLLSFLFVSVHAT